MQNKIQIVREYQDLAPMSLKAYVVGILGHKCCESWSFETLADEFGLGYMRYVNGCLEKFSK